MRRRRPNRLTGDESLTRPCEPVGPPPAHLLDQEWIPNQFSESFPDLECCKCVSGTSHFLVVTCACSVQLNYQIRSQAQLSMLQTAKDSPDVIRINSDEYIFSPSRRHDPTRSIFVGGLSKFTTNKSLYKHFLQFGTITGCTLARNKQTGASMDYGFVEFELVEQAESTCEFHPHVIDGQEVSVRLGSRKGIEQKFTLFVGGLSKETSVETLRKYFSKFGQLTNCEVKLDRQTGQSRGFGFVGFNSQEDLDSALYAQPHIIDDTKVKFNYATNEFDVAVTSLSPHITEEELNDFFSRYGELRRCEILETSPGARTGFVRFSSEKEISQALSDRPHIIGGKMVNTNQKGQCFDIFVGNLPSDATDDLLFETFSKYGKIVHWEVKRDHNTNRLRGFGYVSFEKAEEAIQAVNGGPFILNGKHLTVDSNKRLSLSKKSFK
ncbi:RNA recognition motif domain-containing protein [Ditylenchus destructor]|nr:RNA recognition motif domain-containing protein [Ditylenchus destructor]